MTRQPPVRKGWTVTRAQRRHDTAPAFAQR